jgi:hypothetical protein
VNEFSFFFCVKLMNVLSKLTYHHLDLLHHWRIRKCRLWGVTLAAQLLSNSPSSHLKTLRSVCLSVCLTHNPEKDHPLSKWLVFSRANLLWGFLFMGWLYSKIFIHPSNKSWQTRFARRIQGHRMLSLSVLYFLFVFYHILLRFVLFR